MAVDPGIMTDATGEGMAGATDVSLVTQKNLKNTYYNNSKPCIECGLHLDPYRALHNQYCANCSNRKSYNHVKNGMVS